MAAGCGREVLAAPIPCEEVHRDLALESAGTYCCLCLKMPVFVTLPEHIQTFPIAGLPGTFSFLFPH